MSYEQYEHTCKYFMFQVKAEFEPYTFINGNGDGTLPVLYQRVEYAISGCACGASKKSRVKQAEV